MDQKYLTDSESLSLNIEATCLLLSSPRNFQYEIKTDKYNPYPSMISMFTSDSQHPPKFIHAVHLVAYGVSGQLWYLIVSISGFCPLLYFYIGKIKQISLSKTTTSSTLIFDMQHLPGAQGLLSGPACELTNSL